VLQRACQRGLGTFLRQLHDLDSRLSVGLVERDYSNFVANIRVVYDRIKFDSLDSQCALRVGIPAEAALNRYLEALRIWDACIQDINCDTDSITPKLQAKWSRATKSIRAADAGMRKLLQL
jgi:hypothetical protein